MKYVRLTARMGVLPLLLLLLGGCAKEEALDNKNQAQGITLALTVPESETVVTKAASTAPLDGESTLSNVFVFFYPQGATEFALPSYYYSDEAVSAEKSWSHQIPVTELLEHLTPGAAYDVYVMASLPDATLNPSRPAVPGPGIRKGELLSLREWQFTRTDAPLMSFTGKGTVTYTPETGATVNIPLRRTVARLDIALEGLKEGQTASLQLIHPTTTLYWQEGSLLTFDFKNDALTADPDTKQYRAYTYENYPDALTGQKVQLLLSVIKDGSIASAYEPIVINTGTVERNKIYDIKLKVVSDREVSIQLTASDWGAVVQAPADPAELDLEPKANSYIVAPERTIYIPVSQVIDANAFNSSIARVGETEQLTAELVWTDVKGDTSTKGLAADASIAEVEVIGIGPYAALKVTTGVKEGNSLVAVKGEDGKIKWSWHIWVTGFDPEAPENQFVITAKNNAGTTDVDYVFMDRNLGAMTYEVQEYTDKGVGLYYQWGRKDPFECVVTWPTGQAYPTILEMKRWFDADGKSITPGYDRTQVAANGFGGLTENPATYRTNDILYAQGNLSLWGVEGTGTVENNVGYKIKLKTVFDPCPAGWRVAPKNALQQMATNTGCNIYYSASNVIIGCGPKNYTAGVADKKFIFPHARYLNADGSMTSHPHYGGFWTASEAGAYALWFHLYSLTPTSSSFTQNGVKTAAMNLRCIKDDPAYLETN